MSKLFGSVAVAVLVFGFASVGNAAGLTLLSGQAVVPTSTLVLKPTTGVTPTVVAPAAAPKVPVLAPVATAPLVNGGLAKVTSAPIVVIRR